jgi:hypothetical protein
MFMSYSEYGQKKVTCPHCASHQVQRRIGRIRFARSEESRLDDLSDPASLEGLEDDPRALGRMMRKMKNEIGGEADGEMGPEFDEVINRLEAGQNPDEIEKAVPDLGAGLDAGGDDDF